MVDLINTSYWQILNRIQENDENHIDFMKQSIDKFSTIFDGLGKEIRDRSDRISDSAEIVSSSTDIKLFIEHNRSNDNFLVKERF